MARHSIPSLQTYAVASDHEKNVVPIRGRDPECKPIGARKDTHFTIRRLTDESIAACCYGSQLIRWYPDGRIFINNGGYPSQTSHDFITRLVGRWAYATCCAHDGKSWITQGPDKRAYPLAKGGQFFTWDSQDNPSYLIAETPNYPVTHVIDKPAMRAARKEIAPFIKYFNNMMKLTEWAPLDDKTVYLGTDKIIHERMLSDDMEEWARVMSWLLQQGTVVGYAHVYDPNTNTRSFQYRRYVSKNSVKDRITRALLATHRSKLLTKRTHTSGGWVKDAYKDYADD
jgi:hypothetical protein